MLLSELAKALNLSLIGEDKEFTGLNTLENAEKDEVSFLANPKYTHMLASTKACAVIVSAENAEAVPSSALVSDNPYYDFARAGAIFSKPQGEFSGISPLASIDSSASIAQDCTIYPFAFIGPRAKLGTGCIVYPGAYIGEDVCLGEECKVYPNAVILAGVTAGDECVIGPGAILGADGFGFIRINGTVQEIPQIGTVSLADGVDVGANVCIDKATLGSTSIGEDTKIDNLVQVAHNVQVGEQCFLISQVGIAGSTRVGDRVTIAGQAGISGHLSIGSDVVIGPQAGVPKSIPDGVTGSGYPFMESGTYRRSAVLMAKLPDMNRKIQQLEKELLLLKEKINETIEKENV